jgi:glycosyltransferase involved in cell wall biosynthesis
VLADLGEAAAGVELRIVPTYSADELPGLLRDATAAVLPSYVEGFPLAVLELAAAGVPTVAYDVPGPRILLSQIDPRLLAPEGDVAEVARRIEMVLGMSETEDRALRARAMRVAAGYTWERIADEHLVAYANALERLRPR